MLFRSHQVVVLAVPDQAVGGDHIPLPLLAEHLVSGDVVIEVLEGDGLLPGDGYRPDEKVMFSVGGTVGNGENMVNAGISFALDRTNHVSNSRTALAREVIDLRGQLAEMGAKMAKMEKAFGMLDETKTKLFPDIPANHWA